MVCDQIHYLNNYLDSFPYIEHLDHYITYHLTKDMLADVLTKGLGREKHYCFIEGMGLIDSTLN